MDKNNDNQQFPDIQQWLDHALSSTEQTDAIGPDEHAVYSAGLSNIEDADLEKILAEDWSGVIPQELLEESTEGQADISSENAPVPAEAFESSTEVTAAPEDENTEEEPILPQKKGRPKAKKGYGLWYNVDEIPVTGIRASGVKSIKLKDDEVVSSHLFDSSCEYITIIMDKGTAKRLKLSEVEKTSRANRGILLMKEIKSNPSKIIKTYLLLSKEEIVVDNSYNRQWAEQPDKVENKHYILGIIATAGCIFCFVKLIIRTIEDIRSAHDYAEWKQNQEKKKSQPQENAD